MTGAAALPLRLPDSPAAVADLSWDGIKALYDTLHGAPLDHVTLAGWLAGWSRLEELITEAASLAMIAYTCDTTDPAKEAAHLRFSAELLPRIEEESVRLARKLVASSLEPVGLAVVLERFRTSIALFREENVPLFTQLEELGTAYQRLTGGMTAEWDGERQPLPRLAPHLQATDRSVRERAFRATVEPYVTARDQASGIFDQMLALRQEASRRAGFANFRDYIFPAKFRFDYHPGDCLRFHDAVEEVVVPAVHRVLEERRTRLRLDTLRPWDLAVNPYRDAPIRPYQDPADLPRVAQRMFAHLDSGLGEQFRTMIEEGLLDLESRAGKAPGGYCDTLHARGRPFIFMNASGVMDDVMTLLHEAGHAFHAFAAHQQPMVWQRHAGSEAAELASMSMELLAARLLARPVGYLADEDARRAGLEHLEGILGSLAHIASVDAFQHWIYTELDGADAVARDAAWVRIRGRFDTGVDWSGLDQERIARWYRQLHIFLYPFYYIEYGIAQLGALQVWRESLRDPRRAIAGYRRFLSLGATRRLPELYQTAGAVLVFDRDRLRELVTLVEEEAATLRAGLSSREVASR